VSCYVDCNYCEVPVLNGETVGAGDEGHEFCSTHCVASWQDQHGDPKYMNEADFKAACDLIREECAKMDDNQIAILTGLIIHDQDERETKVAKEATG
jgi:hypothetical protein